jgi:hypothetical protein
MKRRKTEYAMAGGSALHKLAKEPPQASPATLPFMPARVTRSVTRLINANSMSQEIAPLKVNTNKRRRG